MLDFKVRFTEGLPFPHEMAGFALICNAYFRGEPGFSEEISENVSVQFDIENNDKTTTFEISSEIQFRQIISGCRETLFSMKGNPCTVRIYLPARFTQKQVKAVEGILQEIQERGHIEIIETCFA